MMSIIILTIIVFACIFTKKSIFDAYGSIFVPMKYICTKKSIVDAYISIFVPRKYICTKKSIFVPKINLFSNSSETLEFNHTSKKLYN